MSLGHWRESCPQSGIQVQKMNNRLTSFFQSAKLLKRNRVRVERGTRKQAAQVIFMDRHMQGTGDLTPSLPGVPVGQLSLWMGPAPGRLCQSRSGEASHSKSWGKRRQWAAEVPSWTEGGQLQGRTAHMECHCLMAEACLDLSSHLVTVTETQMPH